MISLKEIDEHNYIYARNSVKQAARELRARAEREIDDEIFEGRDYQGDRIFWHGLHSVMGEIIEVLEVSTFEKKYDE